MTQENVDSRNHGGYMRLMVDVFGPRENYSSITPIETQRNLKRLALIAPFEYPEVAEAVDKALAELAAKGPLVEREIQALRLRYALDEPGVLYNSYSEVGRRLPRYHTDSTLGPEGTGISQTQARGLTLRGLRKLRAYCQQHEIYGFRLPPNPSLEF